MDMKSPPMNTPPMNTLQQNTPPTSTTYCHTYLNFLLHTATLSPLGHTHFNSPYTHLQALAPPCSPWRAGIELSPSCLEHDQSGEEGEDAPHQQHAPEQQAHTKAHGNQPQAQQRRRVVGPAWAD